MADGSYLIFGVIVIVLGFLVENFLRNRRFWKLYMQFPGDKLVPIVGNALWFNGNSEDIMVNIEKMWKRNGCSTFRCKIGSATFVGLNDPENIEIILGNYDEIKKIPDYDFLRSWLGDGLLLSVGNKWRRRRKIITPTFHYRILEQFLDVFHSKGTIFIKNLTREKGKIFDIYPYITLCTLDMICETSMGTNVNAQENSESEYVKAVYSLSEIFHHRSYSVWKRSALLYRLLSSDFNREKKALEVLHGMTDEVIRSRRKAMENNNSRTDFKPENEVGIKNRTAFLDLLLSSVDADGKPLSDACVREEVDTFMFEGHDTTSSCIAFAIYCLANNPKVQSSAFEEQFLLFANDKSKEATLSDLQNMNYLERVIKETLRIFPSVPFYGRQIENDLTLPDGRIMPGGCLVAVQPFLMGRNPKYFPDPLKFDPDRFLPENMTGKHPFMFVPFSAGPRNCIGQKFAMLEIKSTLSKLLKNFELASAGPEYEPKLVSEIILRSKNGIHVILKERKYI